LSTGRAPSIRRLSPARARPSTKTDGDEVYAGTVNQEGRAREIRTAGAGSDTTLERIIRRVREAQEAQSPTESLIDRFAKYYTPAVIVLAIGAYAVAERNPLTDLVGHRLSRALVIGPPVSIVSAIGNAARSGVLMKGGEHLERAGKIDLVAFDKTGTLTKGETAVVDVAGFGAAADEVLSLAATAERRVNTTSPTPSSTRPAGA